MNGDEPLKNAYALSYNKNLGRLYKFLCCRKYTVKIKADSRLLEGGVDGPGEHI